MNRTIWIIIGAVCLVGFGALVAFTKKDSVSVDGIDPSKIIQSTNGTIGDRVYGNKNAKVVIFEYGDFQCPGCVSAEASTVTIREHYRDQAAFVFRNLPLTTIHPNALAGATVAEAAGQQGKYWEMHDLLYNQRSDWIDLSADKRDSVFHSFAGQLNLNTKQFDSDLISDAVTNKIARDRALASKLNIEATPTFFINSTQVNTTVTDDTINGKTSGFMDLIDAALKATGETPPARS